MGRSYHNIPQPDCAQSLNDYKNLFRVTSTHIQCRLFLWHCSMVWLLELTWSSCVLVLSARTYLQLNFTCDQAWPWYPEITVSSSVAGGQTGNARWSQGTGVGCHRPATLHGDNSSLLTSEAMTGHTKTKCKSFLLARGQRTLTEVNS